MLVAGVDWTMVLETLIFTTPAILAAVFAGMVHRQIRTPSGKSIGEVAEYAHDTAIANNMLLRVQNGATSPATREQIHTAGSESPSVPSEPAEAPAV